MRSIKDDFQPIDGSPVFYTPVLRGPEWKRQGLPRIGPVDRMVWHYLRAIDGVKRPTVAEIARQVWHPDGDYRSSARSSLKRLKASGLAESDSKKRWYSLFPDSKGGSINPESGQINPDLEKCQSGQINPESGLINPEIGSINPPCNLEQGGLINPPKVGQSTHLSGQINPDKWVNQPTIEKREERRKEKLASAREDSGNSFSEKQDDLDDWLEDGDGVDIVSALKSHPAVFSKGFPIPEALPALEIYFEMAVQAELKYRSLIGKPVLKTRYIGGLLYDQFREDPKKAQDALRACIKTLKAERSKRATSRKAEVLVKISSSPGLPSHDEQRDSLKVDLQAWLKDRFPGLSKKIRKIEDSTADDLEYLRVRSARMQDRFGGMWDKKGSRSKLHSEHVRSQYLQEVWLFAKDLEGVGV